MNLKPLGNRVIVEVIETDEKVVGGIVLPETAKKTHKEGKVVAIGSGRYRGEKLIPVPVEVGMIVLFKDYAASEIDIDEDGKFIILDADDILAIKE